MSDPRLSLAERTDRVKTRVALSALVGRRVKLVAKGREHVGLCPFHNEKTPSFTVRDDKQFYHCFGCGAHGSALDFVMHHEGLEFFAALERLEGDAGLADESATRRESVKAAPSATDWIESRAAAGVVWVEGQPARSTIAEAWFRSRGLEPAESGALDVLRFHPRCPAGLWRKGEDPARARRHAPALLAPFLRVEGGPGERRLALQGVHVTFLAADGAGKAQFKSYKRRDGQEITPPSRVMWGKSKRGAVLFPARPLPSGSDVRGAVIELLDAPGLLVVGEGLESTASLLARVADARLAAAVLSLDNLQGLPLRVGKRAALPLWRLRPELEHGRPFTFSQPGSVIVGVDADMKAGDPAKPGWVQEERGALPVRRALSSLERSWICAELAVGQWRAAGGNHVAAMRPPLGHDFNDLDQMEAFDHG